MTDTENMANQHKEKLINDARAIQQRKQRSAEEQEIADLYAQMDDRETDYSDDDKGNRRVNFLRTLSRAVAGTGAVALAIFAGGAQTAEGAEDLDTHKDEITPPAIEVPGEFPELEQSGRDVLVNIPGGAEMLDPATGEVITGMQRTYLNVVGRYDEGGELGDGTFVIVEDGNGRRAAVLQVELSSITGDLERVPWLTEEELSEMGSAPSASETSTPAETETPAPVSTESTPPAETELVRVPVVINNDARVRNFGPGNFGEENDQFPRNADVIGQFHLDDQVGQAPNHLIAGDWVVVEAEDGSRAVVYATLTNITSAQLDGVAPWIVGGGNAESPTVTITPESGPVAPESDEEEESFEGTPEPGGRFEEGLYPVDHASSVGMANYLKSFESREDGEWGGLADAVIAESDGYWNGPMSGFVKFNQDGEIDSIFVPGLGTEKTVASWLSNGWVKVSNSIISNTTDREFTIANAPNNMDAGELAQWDFSTLNSSSKIQRFIRSLETLIPQEAGSSVEHVNFIFVDGDMLDAGFSNGIMRNITAGTETVGFIDLSEENGNIYILINESTRYYFFDVLLHLQLFFNQGANAGEINQMIADAEAQLVGMVDDGTIIRGTVPVTPNPY